MPPSLRSFDALKAAVQAPAAVDERPDPTCAEYERGMLARMVGSGDGLDDFRPLQPSDLPPDE